MQEPVQKMKIKEILPAKHLAQSKPFFVKQSLISAPEVSNPFLEVNLDPFVHQQP